MKDIRIYLDVSLDLTEELVLTGVTQVHGVSLSQLKKINHALAIGKVTISKFKYGKVRNILEIYETECRIRKFW